MILLINIFIKLVFLVEHLLIVLPIVNLIFDFILIMKSILLKRLKNWTKLINKLDYLMIAYLYFMITKQELEEWKRDFWKFCFVFTIYDNNLATTF